MNWYEIWTHVLAALKADGAISAVLGTQIWLDGEKAIVIPSMTCLFVVNTEEEVYAPVDWQFDIYAKTLADIVAVEKAMMRLLNQPLPVTIGEAQLTSEFTNGQLLRGPERDPYFRRILEFTFTPVRGRYYQPEVAGA